MTCNRAQVSVELVTMVSVAMGILLIIYLANQTIEASWESQKQSMEASLAANSMALQVGNALSGGNGTSIRFLNRVMEDVSNMTLFNNGSILVTTVGGNMFSAPLATRNVAAPASIPLNQYVTIRNTNGSISIEAS